ncbi:ATP-binding protein [Veillonella sp.]|jgi:ATP-binding region ATPase domain protein|uniref:ATP-binding protein n=1 Tax=Veillonella sp. TaxID=1926307 RepID=UPI002902522C|nr:ATP-binding protein [Veillonella sp.]MDU1974054.1 ATP-binding protein [Veillonella sp.]MDU5495897.1 ATP-binding protein [Veillonella sp.]
MNVQVVEPRADILVESTRSIGYTFESALADIIDNSIGNGATHIDVRFSSIDPRYIAILDDGCGMTPDELIIAMRYGSKNVNDQRAESDLGRFGLGLKTASLSQCRKLTVISKKNNVISAASWDLDFIIEQQGWSLKVYDYDEIVNQYNKAIPGILEQLNAYETGTIVIWENFDKMLEGASEPDTLFDEKISIARSHLELIYHNFLDKTSKSPIEIRFNYLPLAAKDPFLTKHPGTQPLSEEYINLEGHNIKVKPYILPYINKLSPSDIELLGTLDDLRNKQGIYVYRNNRLIIWGTWFRLDTKNELNKLARIRVDIPNSLDHIWDIDIKKSTASLPNSIKQNLKFIVIRAIGSSERVYIHQGNKLINDEYDHVWELRKTKEETFFKINKELLIYKAFLESLSAEQAKQFKALIKLMEATVPFKYAYTLLAKNEGTFDKDYSDEARKLFQDLSSFDTMSREELIMALEKIDFFANNA